MCNDDAMVALFSVVLGAVVGGAISAATTWTFNLLAARERRLGLAHSIFFKTFRMADASVKITRHVEENWAADDRGQHWPKLMPLAGVRATDESFTPEELSLFARKAATKAAPERPEDQRTAAKLLVAANSYHILVDVLLQFNEERKELSREFAERGLVDMEEGIGRIVVDEQTHKLLAPKMREVEVLTQLLKESSAAAKRNIIDFAGEVGPRLKEALNDKRFTLGMGPKSAEGMAATPGTADGSR